MSFKLKLKLKPIAALAIAGAAVVSAAALTGSTAYAATERCGPDCVTMAARSLGPHQEIAVSGNGGVLMRPGFNPREDFIAVPVGTVAQLALVGQIPKALASTYGAEVVYELNFAPAGALTGDCLGISSTKAGSATKIQFCGSPVFGEPTPLWEGQKGALWIGVFRDHSGNFEPFVNVAASSKAALVLTAKAAGGPVTINHMSIKSGSVASNQMWESLIGVFGQAQAWPTPQGSEPPYLLP